MVTFLRLVWVAAKPSADSLILLLVKGCDKARKVWGLHCRSVLQCSYNIYKQNAKTFYIQTFKHSTGIKRLTCPDHRCAARSVNTRFDTVGSLYGAFMLGNVWDTNHHPKLSPPTADTSSLSQTSPVFSWGVSAEAWRQGAATITTWLVFCFVLFSECCSVAS